MKNMSKKTNSRKKKNKRKKVDKMSVKYLTLMFSFALYLLFVAFYSHGVVSADDLEIREVEIVDIVKYHRSARYGGAWLSFLTSDNERFYCETKGPNGRAIYELKDITLPVSAKVSYGRPQLLFTDIISFDSHHRLATLEIDGNMIVDIEHYNAVNFNRRVACTIVIAIVMLAATFPYLLFGFVRLKRTREEKSKIRKK